MVIGRVLELIGMMEDVKGMLEEPGVMISFCCGLGLRQPCWVREIFTRMQSCVTSDCASPNSANVADEVMEEYE